ncbi:MAG: histidine kinase [Segetibacter sp.]
MAEIAFGGVDGYTVFNPLRVADDTFSPSVALTGIRINNIPADYGYPASPFKAAINSVGKIVLPYTQNFLTFEFAALEYNITEKLQYRYKLEGLNENWVNAGNDNVATYTRISPGHYTLMINATNTAGKWSSHIKTLSVIIEPPFWKTWWFTALWVLAVAGIIYLIIINRIKKVRKEEQQKAAFEREASELKAEALRAQMNPHFIFNCLNSIKALIQEDNKQQAVTYLTTFSKLIRNQLNTAQREISLYEELETCRLYTQLEALRFSSKIVCEFKIDENVDTHSLKVPPLILQPFIENAIWHGVLPKESGKVKISVTGKDDFIQCAIEDDGIGRETSMRSKCQTSVTYQSKGMKLVQGRLSLHNVINNQGGTIELIDKQDARHNPAGTLIIVTFKKNT